MKRDIRFVAYHPAIVAGPEVKQISRPHLVVADILHSKSGAAGYDHADMFDFAKRRSHMLRPFASGIINGPPDRHRSYINSFQFSFFECEHFIGLLNAIDQHYAHITYLYLILS